MKNDSELANVLGRAFAGYANFVETGHVDVYRPLFTEKSVTVLLTVTENGLITVNPLPSTLQPEPTSTSAQSPPRILHKSRITRTDV